MADRIRNNENYQQRVSEHRRELFPAITAEEDAAIAARTGRERRVLRCQCGRSYKIAKGCWFCRADNSLMPNARPNTRETRKR